MEDLEWKALGPLRTMERDYLFCVFPEAKLRSIVRVAGVKLQLKKIFNNFFQTN